MKMKYVFTELHCQQPRTVSKRTYKRAITLTRMHGGYIGVALMLVSGIYFYWLMPAMSISHNIWALLTPSFMLFIFGFLMWVDKAIGKHNIKKLLRFGHLKEGKIVQIAEKRRNRHFNDPVDFELHCFKTLTIEFINNENDLTIAKFTYYGDDAKEMKKKANDKIILLYLGRRILPIG